MKTIIITLKYKKRKGEKTVCSIMVSGIESVVNKKMAELLVQGCTPKKISESETHSTLTYLLKIS